MQVGKGGLLARWIQSRTRRGHGCDYRNIRICQKHRVDSDRKRVSVGRKGMGEGMSVDPMDPSTFRNSVAWLCIKHNMSVRHGFPCPTCDPDGYKAALRSQASER